MAVAGERSTDSYSTEFGVTTDTFLASLARTPKTDGPGWISLTDTSYDAVYGYRRIYGRRRYTLTGYKFECTIVFDPSSSVSAGSYDYSFDIILRQALGGTTKVGTVSGSVTVTRPAPTPTPRPRYVPLTFVFDSTPDGVLAPGDSGSFTLSLTRNVGQHAHFTINTSLSYTKTGEREYSNDGSRVETLYDFSFRVPRSTSTGLIPINAVAGATDRDDTVSIDTDVRVYAGRWPSVPSFVIRGTAGTAVRQVKNLTSAGFSRQGSPSGFNISGLSLTVSGNQVIVSGTMPSSDASDSYSLSFRRRHNVIGEITASRSGTVSVDVQTGTVGGTLSWDSIDDIIIHVGEPESPTSVYHDLGQYVNGTYTRIEVVSVSPAWPGLRVLSDYLSGGIPRVSSRTSYSVSVRATNSNNNTSANTSFTVILAPLDDDDDDTPPPVRNQPPRWKPILTPFASVQRGKSSPTFAYLRQHVTGDGTIVFQKVTGESWITVYGNGRLSMQPNALVPVRRHPVRVRAVSVFGLEDKTLLIEVTADPRPEPPTPPEEPTPEPPAFSTLPVPLIEVQQGQSNFADLLQYVTPNDGSVRFSKTGGARWIVISDAGRVTATPPASTTVGNYTVTVNAISTAGSASTSAVVRVTAIPPPAVVAPTWNTIPAQSVGENLPFSQNFSGYIASPAAGTTNTPTSFSVSASPYLANLTISTTGHLQLRNAPLVSAHTAYSITITASNSAGSNSTTFTLTVRNVQPPVIRDIPANLRQLNEGADLSLPIAGYVDYETSLTVTPLIPGGWYSWNGTALVGRAPAVTGNVTWNFRVTATNSDGTVSRTFSLTVIDISPPEWYTGISDIRNVDEGESFRLDLKRNVRGSTPTAFELQPGYTLPDWITLEDGVLFGAVAPFVETSASPLVVPPILVRVYGASRTLFNNASINVRVHDTTGRAHPKWKAIPDQVQTAGDLFDFELPEYLTGDEPIDVFQNPDKKKQRWLYVLSLFNREGKRLHGTVPYDRNQTETRHITIYLVASNGTVDDYVSFRMAIQPQVEGAPSWQNIGVLRRLGGKPILPFNPRISVTGKRPISISLKAGSESAAWFRDLGNGNFGGTPPAVTSGSSRFESNIFVATNEIGSAEAPFTFEIYNEATTFRWRDTLFNITVRERDKVSENITHFAEANSRNEFRLAVTQPDNEITWNGLMLSSAGLITAANAPIVNRNEVYRLIIEGRINTTDVWIPQEFLINIENEFEGQVRWEPIPPQSVNELSQLSFSVFPYVEGKPPITTFLTPGKRNPSWVQMSGRGLLRHRGAATPAVNRDTEHQIYISAINSVGIRGNTQMTLVLANTGTDVAGPSVNSPVVLSLNSDTAVNEDVKDLLVNSYLGVLSFRKITGISSLSITRTGRLIGRTPVAGSSADYDIAIDVSDSTGTSRCILRVRTLGTLGNLIPSFVTFQIPDVNEGEHVRFDLNRYVRGERPRIRFEPAAVTPEWLSIEEGILEGLAPEVDSSTLVTLQIEAINPHGMHTVTKSFRIIDVGAIKWLTAISTAREVDEGEEFSLDLNALTSGEEPIIISFVDGKFVPNWLSITGGVLSGTAPAVDRTRYHRIYLAAINSYGRVDASFRLSVLNTTNAPTLEGLPDREFNELQRVAIFTHPYATGDNLTFSMSGGPRELTIDSGTGLISTGTSGLADVPATKTYDIVVTITNAQGSDSDTFKLKVNDLDAGAPVWKSIEDIFVNVGQRVHRELADYLIETTEFPVRFTKTPGKVSAAWITVDENSGEMSGEAVSVPEETEAFVYVTATNSIGSDTVAIKITTSTTFVARDAPAWNQIEDVEVNEGGVIRIETNIKLLGQGAIGFDNAPVDIDGNVFQWEPPNWLNISTDGLGVITGSAPFVDADETYTIYLLAFNQSRDGKLQTGTTDFDILVKNVQGIKPEIENVTLPTGILTEAFVVDVDFNVEVTGVSLDAFDFEGVDIAPHSLFYGETPTSRGSESQLTTKARYFQLRFPPPAEGIVGNLNIFLKRHSVRIA